MLKFILTVLPVGLVLLDYLVVKRFKFAHVGDELCFHDVLVDFQFEEVINELFELGVLGQY